MPSNHLDSDINNITPKVKIIELKYKYYKKRSKCYKIRTYHVRNKHK